MSEIGLWLSGLWIIIGYRVIELEIGVPFFEIIDERE